MKRSVAVLAVALVGFEPVFSQSFGSGYHRLTNKSLGDSLSIDIVNDGVNNTLQMAATGERSGQHWLFTAVGSGFFRLTTQWQGPGRSLDVVNDGVNRFVQLAGSGNFSGQFWRVSLAEPGYYRLTSQWLGESRSLAAVRTGSSIQLALADTNQDASQLWKIAAVSSSPSATNATVVPSRTPVVGTPIVLSGFQIMVDRNIAATEQVRTALDLLSNRLQQIISLLKPGQVAQLRKVPIWIEYKRLDDGAMWYHPNRDWLVANGYPASMEKSIEIKNVSNFLSWQGDQPMMVLHEFAHAYSDLFIPQFQTALNVAFDAAVRSGKYESVAYVRGGRRKAYAMNNRTEYFAELSEAYFGRNDYFPFTRDDLRVFDPVGFKLMQDAWQ